MKNQKRLLQVALLGHPVLRKKAKQVDVLKLEMYDSLICDMTASMLEVDGVGIAAPQVYESVRIIIIASHPNARYPDAPHMKPVAMINPLIVHHGSKVEDGWEGCLSIPGIRGIVPRFTSIRVEYLDRHGVKKTKSYRDFVARIVQHEIDHLNGILFIDRIRTSRDLYSEKEFLKKFAKESS